MSLSIVESVESWSERPGMSSIVVSARLIGTMDGMADDVWLGSGKKGFARDAGRNQRGRIGLAVKSARRSTQANDSTTNERGEDYARIAERNRGEERL